MCIYMHILIVSHSAHSFCFTALPRLSISISLFRSNIIRCNSVSIFFLSIWRYRHARLATQQGAYSLPPLSRPPPLSPPPLHLPLLVEESYILLTGANHRPSCNQCTIAVVTTTYDTRYPPLDGFYVSAVRHSAAVYISGKPFFFLKTSIDISLLLDVTLL